MNNESLVSCIIPTYKRCDTLNRAIDSVLNQSYKNIEILVVDDNEPNSDDSKNVEKIINNYDDSRVKLIKQKVHINGAEARNVGIKASEGEYIGFLDDDDEWLPSKIERQLEILSNDDVDGVSCLYNEYMGDKLIHSCPPYTGDNLHKKIFQREVAVFTSTILLRKNALFEAGLFNNKLRRHQDLQLLLDFTKDHKISVLNDYLVKLHCDSPINNPSYERFKSVKKDFFNVVSSHLELYSKKEQSQIMAAHRFELVFSALKERRLWSAVVQLIKVGVNIPAYKMLVKRFKDKKYIAIS